MGSHSSRHRCNGIKKNLDIICHGYVRKWLDTPVSGTVKILQLTKAQFGQEVIDTSTNHTLCQVTFRKYLKSSINDDIRYLHNITSEKTNIQYASFHTQSSIRKRYDTLYIRHTIRLSCDKMPNLVENCIREAIKNIKEKKRKKCNLAAIKKYLEDENSLPDNLELQLHAMVKRGLINKEETYSLGSACKGATAAVMLGYSDEYVMGECNVKHINPEVTTLSERIEILESKLESTTQLNCSLQPSPHPIDPVIPRFEKEVEFLKQEILVKNRQISSLIDSLKYNKIHENSGNGRILNDVDKVGCNTVTNSNLTQVEKGTPMGKRQALDNLSVNRRRQMPRIPDRENKFSLEQQRTIVPGELTYAESTKGIRVMSDGTKKVENSHCMLSMEKYPALYNRFSPLSADNSNTNRDEGIQKENIDDGESGLSKRVILLNRQRRSAAEAQKQSEKYTKPTTVVLGDSIAKNIKGFKMKEATDHQENVTYSLIPWCEHR